MGGNLQEKSKYIFICEENPQLPASPLSSSRSLQDPKSTAIPNASLSRLTLDLAGEERRGSLTRAAPLHRPPPPGQALPRMASWLKAAEVVDRRAKLVASELADETPDSQPSVSSGREVQVRANKDKNELRRSSNEPWKPSDNVEEDSNMQSSVPHVALDVTLSEKLGTIFESTTAKTSTEPPYTNTAAVTLSTAEGLENSPTVNATNNVNEVSITDQNVEAPTVSENRDLAIEATKDVPETSTPSRDSVDFNDDAPEQKVNIVNDTTSLKVDQDNLYSERAEEENTSYVKDNDNAHALEASLSVMQPQDKKSEGSAKKVQDQLDEAQGLLKSAISTGQSKEARLARVCAGLSSRLQEYKSENAQLEELLVAERERRNLYEARIKELQQDLSLSRIEVTKVETNMADALAAKNAEIEALVSSMDALRKQASTSEGKFSSLQANMEAVMRSRELTETRVIQALREELAVAERRAEEERAAHNATKMAAVEREVELEHRAVEASNALARIQRIADESTSKAMELEHKVALLEVECASLNQELQDMESRVRRGQKKSSEEANQILQIQAWQEEVERARQGQRDAESKLSSLEANVQKMRVEMAGMRRDAEHYSRQEHMELEKRYRELTDLLYHKQTQLEAMASEKAAAQFQLEEAKRLQEVQVEAERSRASRRTSSSTWEDDSDLKSLEPLPLHHRHMVGASIQLQKAAKLLDSGAVRATRFLWRYPTARIILLLYLVFVHLFLMYLLHRLQEQADSLASGELAASMGLSNSSLP
ncbi:hypothetical protein Taro_011258 [Colocasia esculenta]|uniref:Golgin-84 n=1 Tax=Colocasia esculenta TaxID=4460 RepID=A0A843U5E8_COLES|nr:hypothetical protein [Colocasia esculenta]